MKFVSSNLMGGLGNQLFQIFAVIAYSIKHNSDFVFEYTKDLKTGIIRATYWDNFLSELNKYTTNGTNNDHIKPYLHTFPKYRENGFHFTEIPAFTNTGYLSLFGYFQSYKYFKDYWGKIKDLIQLETKQLAIKNEYRELLGDCYNISMHFRIGDYKFKQDYHPVMKLDYYDKSLQHIITSLENNKTDIRVIYFCEKDDNDDVKIIIDALSNKYKNITFTKARDDIVDWKQMLLMSCCESNIIANSSFSWWSAYMNDSNDKIVCFPSVWFGPAVGGSDTKDLFPDNWNRINV